MIDTSMQEPLAEDIRTLLVHPCSPRPSGAFIAQLREKRGAVKDVDVFALLVRHFFLHAAYTT